MALSLGMEEFQRREGCALAIHKHSTRPPTPVAKDAEVYLLGLPPCGGSPMDLGEHLEDLTRTADFQRLPEPGVGLQDPVWGTSGPQVCADALEGVGAHTERFLAPLPSCPVPSAPLPVTPG